MPKHQHKLLQKEKQRFGTLGLRTLLSNTKNAHSQDLNTSFQKKTRRPLLDELFNILFHIFFYFQRSLGVLSSSLRTFFKETSLPFLIFNGTCSTFLAETSLPFLIFNGTCSTFFKET